MASRAQLFAVREGNTLPQDLWLWGGNTKRGCTERWNLLPWLFSGLGRVGHLLHQRMFRPCLSVFIDWIVSWQLLCSLSMLTWNHCSCFSLWIISQKRTQMNLCQVTAMWLCLWFQTKQTKQNKKPQAALGASDSWNVGNQDLRCKNLNVKFFSQKRWRPQL